MKKSIFAYFIAILGAILFAYVELPVLRPDFTSFYVVLIGFFLIAGALCVDKNDLLSIPKIAKFNFVIAAILGVFVTVVPFIVSAPILHADAYRNLIGPVVESDFTSDINPVSLDDIRLVDKETAMRLGDKKIGEVPGLGSISKLGEFHIQSVDGQLYWVAPLVHRDLIKWVTNLEGTTGYIKVSATNPQDVFFVQAIGEEPVKIVYQPDAYLHQDLARHLYTRGFVNVGLTDFTFEIDDAGIPHWVVSLYDHKVGFSGADAIGIATVNASTGEVQSYSIEEAPSWIDRIQPVSFVENQLSDWGLYVNGFLNSRIAEEGVLVPTPGTSLVYGEDGKSYWYTGMTSSGADESTIGFMLVDTRTKESRLYKQPGATEIAAMRSAEGKVQEKGYTATFPVMYNIFGNPTYVMSLKDKAGLIKMVSFVSVEDFSLLGLGDTKQDALRSYKEALSSQGNSVNISSNTDVKETTGTITRFSADVQNGNTYYYFTLDTLPQIAFVVTSSISREVPLTQTGDKVSITYDNYGNDNTDVLTFDNMLLNVN
ncbi:MAG: hypothetical protein RR915_06725 [Cellulosilyticaceae bacterium]